MIINLLDLVQQDVPLRQAATTNGGEYAGPCPWCGGQDRFRVWPHRQRPGWWCRGCGRSGDAVGYVMQRHGVGYPEALRRLGIEPVRGNGKNGRSGGRGGITPRATLQPCNPAPATDADVEVPVAGAGRGGGDIPPVRTATVQPLPGCTLARYAEAKRLPIDFLRSLGLVDVAYLGSPAIRIPYLAPDGTEVAVRFRLALTKGEHGDTRFVWKRGAKPCLYGLNRLAAARQLGYVIVVEGESDCHALWYAGLPAVGVPGATNWREERDAPHLVGFERLYVVIEPDQGGEAVRAWVERSALRERVYFVTLDERGEHGERGEHKDPSALWVADPDRERFRARMEAALERAVPWTEQAKAATAAKTAAAWRQCAELAESPDILGRLTEALTAAGVAGEQRAARLLYLALCSRFLPRPVSVAVKGPSSAGKSFLAETVLSFFPKDAYYALSAMSERALAYSEEPLKHRFLVVYEAAGLRSEFASYLVRSLLSEGRVRYETVEKTNAGLKPKLIEREGPTGLLVTTTAVTLHPENETRLLSIPVTDTPEQTRNVLRALAEEATEPPDYTPWHALQEWLASAEHRVTVPFARALAESIPPVAVRLRRDFAAILTLVKAHAILHQASRERDEHGRIVATLADYAAVRDLVADLVADGIEATVSPTVRETVDAVSRILASSGSSGAEETTVMAVAQALKVDKATALRRVRVAIERGYLQNKEERRGRPARLVLGDPLPAEVEILPSAEALAARVVGLHGCSGNRGDTPPSPPTDATDLAARVLAAAEAAAWPRYVAGGVRVVHGPEGWRAFCATAPEEALRATVGVLRAQMDA